MTDLTFSPLKKIYESVASYEDEGNKFFIRVSSCDRDALEKHIKNSTVSLKLVPNESPQTIAEEIGVPEIQSQTFPLDQKILLANEIDSSIQVSLEAIKSQTMSARLPISRSILERVIIDKIDDNKPKLYQYPNGLKPEITIDVTLGTAKVTIYIVDTNPVYKELKSQINIFARGNGTKLNISPVKADSYYILQIEKTGGGPLQYTLVDSIPT